MLDTHVHIWDFEQASYAWLEGNTTLLNRTYALSELVAEKDRVGITGGLLVQAANNFEDTNWMLQNAAQHAWIKGVVGWLPLQNPAATAAALENYTKHPYFKGVRHLIHDEPDDAWLLQPTVLESLGILATYQIPFDVVGIKTAHIRTALLVAEKIPTLQMVFDHLNQPPIASKERYGAWGQWMQAAAKHPNFYAKISGLGTASGNLNGWVVEDLKPYIAHAIELFGTNRCFCGGDWPVSLLAGTYTQIWQAYQTVISSLVSAKEQQQIFEDNATSFYNL